MEIYCKNCDKVLGNYPDEKIPPNVKGYTECRICGDKIELFRKVEEKKVPRKDAEVNSQIDGSLSEFDEIVQSIPLLSGKKDYGVKREDFIAIGLGVLVFFAIIYIYKPDFNPKKLFLPNLKTDLAAEMIKDKQLDPNNLPDGSPEFKELEEAMKEIEKRGDVNIERMDP